MVSLKRRPLFFVLQRLLLREPRLKTCGVRKPKYFSPIPITSCFNRELNWWLKWGAFTNLLDGTAPCLRIQGVFKFLVLAMAPLLKKLKVAVRHLAPKVF